MAFSITRTQPLSDLTAQYLRDNYMLGLRFVNEAGADYPDSFYEQKIDVAISQLENYTTVTVQPTLFENEPHDFHMRDFASFNYLQLFHYPVLTDPPEQYPSPTLSANFGTATIAEFPREWVRSELSRGQLHLLPTAGTMGQTMVTLSGQYLPALYGRMTFVPQMFSATYWAGFPENKVPRLIIDAIAKLATIEILSILGLTIWPPGVTSSSLSVDGLSVSRSINQGQDTAPVFSSLLKQYKNDLYGQPPGIPGILNEIKDYYRGMTMTVL